MPFGEIVVGPPGSGKSTYAYGKHQLFSAIQRPISVVNLDPANDALPYPCAVDIAELLTLQDVMDTYRLGPNGAMLYAMEYLEANFDWLTERLKALGKDAYVVFDLPGQVELSTNHESLKRIIDRLAKELGFRLAAIHLCDAHYVTDPPKYISLLLLSLRAMLHLELPHINVLSKLDILKHYGELDFNLDFYTEVHDLEHLENLLSESAPKFTAMNMAICSVVEEFGLIGFETLAVEDKESMLHLTRVIDKATGYIFVPLPGISAPEGALEHPADAPATTRPNIYGLMTSAAADMRGPASDVRDVQERWIDNREAWDAWERKEWRKEGEIAATANRQAASSVAKTTGP